MKQCELCGKSKKNTRWRVTWEKYICDDCYRYFGRCGY